ncbi:MAG: MBL fold metallo-hydrolase, partial [Phycisphaerae bacterium]
MGRTRRRTCCEPKSIDAVVLSHIHYDHTAGLGGFLEANPRVSVYLPKVFPEGFKREVRGAGATVVETDQPRQICKGAWTTGVLDGGIPEQGLY